MQTNSTPENSNAVCLLSGGLDSATVLFYALRKGFRVTALTVHYGQLHERELESARRIARGAGVKHYVVSCTLPWGGSALVDRSIPIPEDRREKEMATIPATYVPARNLTFLSLAVSAAEAHGAGTVFIGANAIDYSGYPDCRPEFLESFSKTAALGTRAGVEGRPFSIEAPLVKMSKKEIIELAVSLQVPLELTWSCYAGETAPCGRCDSCRLRRKGFCEAGIEDPVVI